MFKLCRYFSIASLVSIIVAALVLSAIYRFLAVDNFIQVGEQQNINLVRSFSNSIGGEFQHLIESSASSPGSDQETLLKHDAFTTLHEAVKVYVKGLPILKVKIFDRKGRTLYSTDRRDVGVQKEEGYPGQIAAISGKVISKLSQRESFMSMNGVIDGVTVVSSYLPIFQRESEIIDGVVEIYTDVTHSYRQINDAQIRITIAASLTLLLLYGVLFLIVRRGEVIMWKQASEKEEHLNEIQRMNDSLNKTAEKLQKTKNEAVEAYEAKSQFLANMSHELRTPLNAIIGYSDMIGEDIFSMPKDVVLGDVQKINKAGVHLLSVVNDILNYSKVESNKVQVYLENFDVVSFVNEVTDTVSHLVRKNDNVISLRFEGDLDTMHSDTTRLRQILFNLLSNASKFTQGGEVELFVKLEIIDGVDWNVFKISDSGIGMTEEQLTKVFEPFVQADESTTRQYGGTGLGLTITKQLCETLGGSVTVESELGKGTQFTVRLPAEMLPPFIPRSDLSELPKPEKVRFTESPPNFVSKRKRISTVLVIDDDPSVGDLMTRFLHKTGFRALVATNADDGLEMAKRHLPDIITLDVMMPGKDGWFVLRELKNDPELKDIPVVMASMVEDDSLGFSLGAAEYLNKPMDWSHLAEVLRKCVRKEQADV